MLKLLCYFMLCHRKILSAQNFQKIVIREINLSEKSKISHN